MPRWFKRAKAQFKRFAGSSASLVQVLAGASWFKRFAGSSASLVQALR